MDLLIVTPNRTEKHHIVWLEVNTDVGNFIIQKGHVPTLLLLAPQQEVVFRLKNGKQESLLVPSGIVEVERERATVIINEQA